MSVNGFYRDGSIVRTPEKYDILVDRLCIFISFSISQRLAPLELTCAHL